ncbi:MAG: hypothetical protein GEU26_08800 [Nitrososphaeraceae archaeon]|nr:hypothetical protein [Nitrososphaeraceae archaeon]
MGAVFRPKDLGRTGYRKVIENSIRDLHPETKDSIIRLLDSWEGTRSEERLKEILGYDKAQDLLKSLNAKKEEQDNLNI